ncbi:uncharacterized protein EI90DRAFT_2053948 [Cantharellus anzutake]|uniref:uncharacterized protein n=1 Tax=Cantharellus anzutake TaxID=1750568 RepID=UPI0019038437|nr:uncharacterized protein EI90DRAFT_2053948 [Cantharellus anzutake]KAF8340366.1 hypothetical protein EI90DRAFT_2053948 [Cantharellus anzutake]
MDSVSSHSSTTSSTRVYVSIKDIVLVYVNTDVESKADDATILALVKAYQNAGGDAVRILRKSTASDSVVRTGSRRNFKSRVKFWLPKRRFSQPITQPPLKLKICFQNYFAHIIISPSNSGKHRWDIILSGRLPEQRINDIPSAKISRFVFELVISILQSL